MGQQQEKTVAGCQPGSLEAQLDALVRKYDLESISVTRQTTSADRKEWFTCVSVRSNDGHYDVTTSGPVAEQLAHCIGTVLARRATPVSLAELVAA